MKEKAKFSLKDFIKQHKHDLILVLSLIFIAVLSLILLLTLRTDGAYARVEIDGEHYATYPLSVDGEYRLGDTNTLTIKDGEAYMKEADCPDKTCVHTRPAKYNGESIICLPNKISVIIVSDNSGIDLEAR